MPRTLLTALSLSVAAHVGLAVYLWPEKTAEFASESSNTISLRVISFAAINEPDVSPEKFTQHDTIPHETVQNSTPLEPQYVPKPPSRSVERRQSQNPQPGGSTTQQATAVETQPSVAAAKSESHTTHAVLAHVKQLLAGHFHYPRLAQRRGWQGIVEISLHIAQDGVVSQVALYRLSGHKVLDQAALDCASKVRAVSQAADKLGPQGINIIVPIHYRLQDS